MRISYKVKNSHNIIKHQIRFNWKWLFCLWNCIIHISIIIYYY